MSSQDEIKVAPHDSHSPDTQTAEMEDRYEVFKKGDGQVDFRTVSWIRAGVIFLKSKGLPKYRIQINTNCPVR
jgi:hypothetical protein